MTPLEISDPFIHRSAFVAPDAQIHGRVTIQRHAVVMFGTVIRAELDEIAVGERTNVQDLSVLHADEGAPCVIGSDTTVGHAAVIHGATIGDHCLIGIGAKVLNHALIGDGAWIAAGSVLPEGKSIPAWTLAMGTPAKPIRDLTSDEVARQREGIGHYLDFAAAYRIRFAMDA